MDSEAVLLQFYQELESDITENVLDEHIGGAGEFRENAFTGILAEELSASGVLESPEVCHYEGGSKTSGFMKANGYSVPEEDTRLDLFITQYNGPADQVPVINASEVETSFRKIERFLGRCLEGLCRELEPASDQYIMAERIHQLRGQIDRVCFYLFTNSRLSQRREKERKTDLYGLNVSYEIWDLERFRRLRESGMSYEPLVVDFRNQDKGGLPCVILDKDESGFQTCVTVFPGMLLYELYDEHGARLLELNVRSYLQARGKVNTGILNTLRKNPQDFMSYNNGITVVAEEIVFGELRDRSKGILELKGMQIVNGGQTTASIHRAVKDFQADMSLVSVQGKVTVVDPGRFSDIVPLISRYSNTQNRVTEADLSANHPFHIGMERVSRREWSPDQKSMWFYERARGSYQTAKSRDGNTPARKKLFEDRYPTAQRFTKEDLARFENTWLGMPHIVSRGGQKNFVQFMQNLDVHEEGWEPDVKEFHRYVAKGILFREAQRIVRNDKSITAYQINVVTYTVALIAEKTARRLDLDKIWQRQGVSGAIKETIASWAPVVFQHLPDYAKQTGRHIGESFKQQACWECILNLNLAVPRGLEDELVVVANGHEVIYAGKYRERALTVKDQSNIARCMELDQRQWLAIAEWGQTSGQLAEWQRGIARTLAGYAAEQWSKLPSSKQAKHGAGMIELARTACVL